MNEMVSVIIPCYNAEKTVRKCVDSILQQTYQQLEILLVDDGSTDQTLSVCNELKQINSCIRVFNQKNQGPGSARNTGIRHAKGRYILFVDSDDTVDKEYCNMLFSEGKEKYADLTICGYQESFFGQKGKKFVYDSDAISVIPLKSSVSLMSKFLLNTACGKLYFREYIIEKDIFFEDKMFVGEDLLFNLRYLNDSCVKNIRIINKPLYFYERGDEKSITHERRENDFEQICFVRNEQIKYLEAWCASEMEIFWRVSLEEILYYLKREWNYYQNDRAMRAYMNNALYKNIVEHTITSKWQKKIYLGQSYRFLKLFRTVQEWKRRMCV